MFDKAKTLEGILKNPTDNIDMQGYIAHYYSFFDEESGNTREEGMKQLEFHLKDDALAKRILYFKALDVYNKAINGEKTANSKDSESKVEKGESSNVNSTLLPIIPKFWPKSLILSYLGLLLNYIFIVANFFSSLL